MIFYNVTVFLEDTDAGGIVYHSRYLNYMERCRTQSFYHNGINHAQLINSNTGHFVVKHIEIDFKKPAYLGEELVITIDVKDVRGASVLFHQTVVRNNEILAEASVLLAFIDPKTSLASRMPEQLKSNILKFKLT
ncbi:MAG: YbgC/FadM family acyl-CoA thioesterase [Candidatus Paracaedibacteraceae bacterium]|nr:YbgC/FadM family acyl-CoA thioesterase [Candidatus Paracaedibacteraceae bacterium]